MPKDEDTHARLVHFFNQTPALAPLIISEPSHLEIWEKIFIFFFKEAPQDDETKPAHSNWRKGSSDSRWDILLPKEKMGAMRALNTLIEGWRNGDIRLPSHKEAA